MAFILAAIDNYHLESSLQWLLPVEWNGKEYRERPRPRQSSSLTDRRTGAMGTDNDPMMILKRMLREIIVVDNSIIMQASASRL